MRKLTGTLYGALTFLALAACSESKLVVTNPDAPDQGRALARPSDVENLVASSFRTVHQNTDGAILTLNSQLLTIGMENYSVLANAGMGPAGQIPRPSVDNSRGNQTQSEKYTPYLNLYRAARSAALGLAQLNVPGFTFYPTSTAELRRDQAFAWFVIGVAMGDVSLVWDSGSAVMPTDPSQALLPFKHYDSLNVAALADLDSAIAYTRLSAAATGGSGFPLPATWINGNALTANGFKSLAFAWKARLRAGVARTPAERAAVNWAAVSSDVDSALANLAADFAITMVNGSPAWTYEPSQMDLYGQWHQMWQYMAGMADTSGQYENYLGTAAGQRVPFLIQSPDRRWPIGNSRANQNTASGCAGSGCLQPAATAPYPYFRNRLSGQDVAGGDPLGTSYYDFYRFQAFYNNNYNSPPNIPTFTLAELRMLKAEGQIRLGNYAVATALIDITRAAAGLHVLTGFVADNTTPIPGQDGVNGSNSCVPQIPIAAAPFTKCGNLMEAMKWEKRMETAYTHWGAWWQDGRGWGDLPNNSPITYPVPYQELDTRRMPLYTITVGAAPGNYGL